MDDCGAGTRRERSEWDTRGGRSERGGTRAVVGEGGRGGDEEMGVGDERGWLGERTRVGVGHRGNGRIPGVESS